MKLGPLARARRDMLQYEGEIYLSPHDAWVYGYHEHRHTVRDRRDAKVRDQRGTRTDQVRDRRDARDRRGASTDSEWREADSFTHQDVVEGLVRYTPNSDRPQSDTKDGCVIFHFLNAFT